MENNLLNEAISSWPRECEGIEEYLREVSSYLKIDLNKTTLKDLKKAESNFNIYENAWEGESISCLILYMESLGIKTLSEIRTTTKN